MKNKFYPYLWFLQVLNKKINLNYENFNPYYEISSVGINSYNSDFSINLYALNLYYFDFDKNLLDFYILLLSKIKYELMINKLFLNVNVEEYIISKWKYKSKFIDDEIYIFINCIKNYFLNYIIYYNDYNFLVFLDYEENDELHNIMNKIIDNFLPMGFECEYVFNNFLMLDIEELSKLERWVLM